MRAAALFAVGLLAVGQSAVAAEAPGHSGVLGPYPMDRDASGTSWQPEAVGMAGLHTALGSWRVMVHAGAFGVFTRQGGPRGGSQAFSTNMAMGAGSRMLGRGMVTLRAMTTLEPLMGPQGYRLLLQTGETGDGRTGLVDRQHPHDLAMELAAIYSHPLGIRGSAFAYGGWPGEPAIGPPAFMHRASADEVPVAPLAHHWLDATHISFGTVTAGLVWGPAKLEGSAFNGHEPDAARWDFERPRFDSRAARLSVNPRPWLSAQVSAALLRAPEILHPTIDVRRYTASVSYAGGGTRPSPSTHSSGAAVQPHTSTGAAVQATLAWGRNVRSADLPTSCPLLTTRSEVMASCAAGAPFAPSRVLDAVLAEASLGLGARHAVFVRAERVEKDELFPSYDPFHVRVFPVGSVQAGYRYELPIRSRLRWAIGVSGAMALVPEFLANEYGRRPLSYWVFAGARLR
jgi:hypothetical protein